MTSRLARITVGGTPRVVDLLDTGPQLGLQPFATTSVWRLGIASAATFAAAGDARNTAMHDTGADGSGQVWVNSSSFSHPIAFAASSDPLAAVTDSAHSSSGIPVGGTFSERIPATARIAGGTDKHMHVITPDGLHAQEHFLAARSSSTIYTCHRRALVDLTGSGIGPQNGVRAYGGSAIAGLIRGWEVDPTHPAYTGAIRHALAVSLRGEQLYYDSTSAPQGFGTDYGSNGYGLKLGYVWPATEQDSVSPTSYTGPIPMGSYFAIPPTVDLTTLGLQTTQGMMLAKAAQDYGCYVTDFSSAQAFYCEDDAGPAATWATAVLGGGAASAHDPRVVFNALRVVTGNGASTPNGAPLGASRRG